MMMMLMLLLLLVGVVDRVNIWESDTVDVVCTSHVYQFVSEIPPYHWVTMVHSSHHNVCIWDHKSRNPKWNGLVNVFD